jgi:hypothetical protein
MCFLGSKSIFLGVDNRLVTTNDFPWSKKWPFTAQNVYNETKNYQERLVLFQKKAIFETNEHFLCPKSAFQANIADMKQKGHVISLFWLEMTIFQTSEGCSVPKK